MKESFLIADGEGGAAASVRYVRVSRTLLWGSWAAMILCVIGLTVALAVVAVDRKDSSDNCARAAAAAAASNAAVDQTSTEKYGVARVVSSNPVAVPACTQLKAAGQKINQRGLDLIKSFEGWSATYYLDAVGIKTIGYGHACHALPCPWTGSITKQQGETILKDDLVSFEKCVGDAVTSPLNRNQFGALVSFAYNLGCGTLRSSTLLKRINARAYDQAPSEMAKWVNANGGPLPGLVRRRKAEGDLFTSTDGCDAPTTAITRPTRGGESADTVYPRLAPGAPSTATNRAVAVVQYLLANFLCITQDGVVTSDFTAFCPPTAVTGIYDDATRDAVIEVQRRNGIYPVDSVCGDSTWRALVNFAGGEGPTYIAKDAGGASTTAWAHYVVKAIQDVVHRTPAGAVSRAPTGVFDAETDAAVRAFQLANGVTDDGIVGRITWPLIAGVGYSAADFTAAVAVPPDGASTADLAQLPDVTAASQAKWLRTVQHLLCNALCPTASANARCVPASGVADAASMDAAKDVQTREGLLPADGSFSRGLLLQMVRAVPLLRLYSGYSASSPFRYAVMAVQAAVGVTEDGLYGPNTEAAVRSAQSSAGIAADGVVGPVTLLALIGGGAFSGCRPKVTVQGVSGLMSDVSVMLGRISCECFGGLEVVAFAVDGLDAAQRGASYYDFHRSGRAADFYVPALANETAIEDSLAITWSQLRKCSILTSQWETVLHGANTQTGAPHIHIGKGPGGFVGRWLSEGVVSAQFASPRGVYTLITASAFA
eukprot:Opistho-2@77279